MVSGALGRTNDRPIEFRVFYFEHSKVWRYLLLEQKKVAIENWRDGRRRKAVKNWFNFCKAVMGRQDRKGIPWQDLEKFSS